MDESLDNRQFLLKYAPKYYTNLDYDIDDLQSRHVFTKLKTIKIAKHAKVTNYSPHDRQLLLSVIKPQKKHLKSLEEAPPSALKQLSKIDSCLLSVQNFASWRVFVGIIHLKSLRIDFASQRIDNLNLIQSQKIEKYLQYRFWSRLNRFQLPLQHLYIHLYNKIDALLYNFLIRFATCQTFLSSLKSFTLFLNNFAEIRSFTIFGLISIYKHVTALKVHEVSYKILEQSLESLSSYKHLTSLNITKTINKAEDLEQPPDWSFLKNLSSLENLHALEFSINLDTKTSLFSFLKSFSLPKSIHKIKFNFQGVTSSFASCDFNSLKSFESKSECQKFYEKWQNLHNFKSLTMCFVEVDHHSCLLNLFFLIPLLKNLTALTELYFTNWCEPSSKEKHAIDFNVIWQAVGHLSSTLKTLYVESPIISLQNFLENPSLRNSHYALQKLGLCGIITGDSKMQNLFQLFQKHNAGASSQFEMDHLRTDSDESFVDLLRELSQISRQISVSLEIDVKKVSSENFVQTLCEFISKLDKRNFSKLHFFNLKSLDPHLMNQLKRKLMIYDISNIIKVSNNKGKVLFMGDFEYNIDDSSSHSENSSQEPDEDLLLSDDSDAGEEEIDGFGMNFGEM